MNPYSENCARLPKRSSLPIFLAALVLLGIPSLRPAHAQMFVNSPDTQRNAMIAVRTQVSNMRNATRVAHNYGDNGVQMVWQQFQSLRNAYSVFVTTLSPEQATRWGNEWAELNAGLDILQEAFANYQQDLANGRNNVTALSDLGHVLDQGGRIWLQQYNKYVSDAHVGW